MPLVALPVAVVALVALIIIFAAFELFGTVFNGIGQFGGTFGGLILRWFMAGIGWAVQQAESWTYDAVKALVGWITTPIFWIKQHIDDLTHAILSAYYAVAYLKNVLIPQAISNALYTARQWVNAAISYTTSEIQQVEAWASGQFTAVYRYTAAEILLAEGYTERLVAAVEQYTAAGLAADARYAEQLYTTAVGYTDSEIKAVEGWVTGEIGTVTAWAGGQITALEKWIAAELPQITAWTSALVGAVALDLANLERDCTDNLCSGLGGAADLLNGLSGDLGIAALLALAAAAAADPVGTADTVDAVIGPVATSFAGAFTALVGA